MQKFSTNVIYSFLGEIIIFGFSFLLGVLTARYLGPAGRGSFWIIYNTAGLLAIIFSMKFRQSVIYNLSKNRDLLGEILLYGLFMGIVTAFCTAFIATFLANIFYSTLLKGIKMSWAIIVLICFSYYLNTLIVAVIEGLLLFYAKILFLILECLIKCFLVSLVLGYYKMQLDDLLLMIGSVETIVYLFIIVILLGKAKRFHINMSSFCDMLKYSAKSFLGTISEFYTLRIDAFFLNYFSGPSEVGIYSVAVSLSAMVLYVPVAIKNVLMPYVACYSDNEITARLSRLLIMVMSILSVFIIPIVWVLVIPIYGEGFFFSRSLFLILFPGSIFWGVFLLIASDIEGRGFPWEVAKVSMTSALLMILMGLILIPMWNSTGAAIVSSIIQGISMILIVYLYKKRFGVNFEKLFIVKKDDFYILIKIFAQLFVNIRGKLSSLLRI